MVKLFKKKFKVRVVRFGIYNPTTMYKIQWAHYRLFPIWNDVCFWFSQGHPGGTECWTVDLFSAADAERIAENLKSPQDLREYYQPMEEEERRWREEEREYWLKNAPYETKNIL